MFGNTGMAIGLIDTINHAGLARHNTKIRWRLSMDLLSSAKRDAVPFYFRRLVRHYDHSRLQLVNQMARSAGISRDVHQDVRPLPEDNGERFYGDYYLELLEREKTVPVTQDIGRCRCRDCSGSMTLLPFQRMVTPTAPPADTTSTCEEQGKADATVLVPLPMTTPSIPQARLGPISRLSPVVQTPLQCPPLCFWSQQPAYYYAAPPYYQQLPPQSLPFVLAHQQQLLAHQQLASRPIVPGVYSSQPRRTRRKPKVVDYQRCCKKYWKYHAVDKPGGRMGAPPHCLDCPVRKHRMLNKNI
jgi:hypothetical protein